MVSQSNLMAVRICFFIPSMDEKLGNSKLKKQVSAFGSSWSWFCSLMLCLTSSRIWFRLKASSFSGSLSYPQQNLMNLILSLVSNELSTFQKLLINSTFCSMLLLYSVCPV